MDSPSVQPQRSLRLLRLSYGIHNRHLHASPSVQAKAITTKHSNITARDAENAEVAQRVETASAMSSGGDLQLRNNRVIHCVTYFFTRFGEAVADGRRLVSCCAPVAQRLEQQTHNLLVRGSNPCGGTNQLASCLTRTGPCFPREFL